VALLFIIRRRHGANGATSRTTIVPVNRRLAVVFLLPPLDDTVVLREGAIWRKAFARRGGIEMPALKAGSPTAVDDPIP
jgi:hypothetical protein